MPVNFLQIRPHPTSTLFPYTTLFRSGQRPRVRHNNPLTTPSHRFIVLRCARDRGLRTRSARRSEEHTSELQSRRDLVCRLLLEKKKVKHSIRALSILGESEVRQS